MEGIESVHHVGKLILYSMGSPAHNLCMIRYRIISMDERELKRQRRKQSNGESAHCSRLHKQAEYDELGQHAETLQEENASLHAKLAHIRSMSTFLLRMHLLRRDLVKVRGRRIQWVVTKVEHPSSDAQ